MANRRKVCGEQHAMPATKFESRRPAQSATCSYPRATTILIDIYVDVNLNSGMNVKEMEPTYNTTLEVRDSCLCLHVQRGARALARRFDEAFRPLALTHGQFSLLMSLNRPDPPTICAVAALIGMDRTSLTAKLKPLERRKLLRVEKDAGDQRSRRLSLTKGGRKLLARAIPIWRKTNAELNKVLTASQRANVRGAMNALHDQ